MLINKKNIILLKKKTACFYLIMLMLMEHEDKDVSRYSQVALFVVLASTYVIAASVSLLITDLGEMH